MVYYLLPAFCGALLLAGCHTQSGSAANTVVFSPSPEVTGLRTDRQVNNDGSVTDIYLGFTQVTYPARLSSSDAPASVIKVEAAGLGIGESGLRLGYEDSTRISYPEGSHMLYIEVNSQEDLEMLQRAILEGDFKDFPKTIVIKPKNHEPTE